MSVQPFKGFTPVPDCIRDELGLAPAAVFGAVWRFGQMGRDRCDATLSKIAERAGLGTTATRTHLHALTAAGWIIAAPSPGRPTMYRDAGRWALIVTGEDQGWAPQRNPETPPPTTEATPTLSVGVALRNPLAPIEETCSKRASKTPPTPTPTVTDPPAARLAPATAAAVGGGHKPPTKPRPKPAATQAPPSLFVLPPADPPPPRVDPWEALYAAAALDLEGKSTAWRSKAGPVLAHYGELARAIGPHVADDPEAAVEVWRAIVTAKKAERLGDGRPVWTVFSPSNAARLVRRHLQDHPGFAARSSSLPPAGVDPGHVRRADDGRWVLRPFGELRAAGHIPPDASPSDTTTWGDAVRLTHAALRAHNAA